MVRLLEQAARHPNDPEWFAGLVHVGRYCGLVEASLAAHAEARRLDPNVPTSHEQTLLMAGDYERLIDDGEVSNPLRVIALVLAGRREEGRALLETLRGPTGIPAYKMWTDSLLPWVERRIPDLIAYMDWRRSRSDLRIFDDPESLFMEGWMFCDVGELERGLGYIERGVREGYWAVATLEGSPAFKPLRDEARFQSVLELATERRDGALKAFRAAGGTRLLGALETS
jgi:hypothetical protein